MSTLLLHFRHFQYLILYQKNTSLSVEESCLREETAGGTSL
jgi:hypothetical protein